MKRNIYLDYAAATPMSQEVIDAMEPYFAGNFYNPSATYLAGREARKNLEENRHKAARLIGARPAEIVFTAGATEANNLAIKGIAQQYPKAEVLVSSIEHESVLAPAGEFNHREIPVTNQGIINLAELEKMVSDTTVLVSVMLVNNELGTVQPLREISEILNKLSISRRAKGSQLPLYLHTDAAQAPNYLDIHASRLGVDLMSLNGGKIYGPKQSGVLYVKAGVTLKPQITGGGQELGLRSGTENTAAAAGFTKALELAQAGRHETADKILKLRRDFEGRLIQNIPKAIINGSKNHRAPHITSASFPGKDNERLMMELDERGIQCAVGSACSASREEASHVLSAIGLDDKTARSTLRFSLGRQTTQKDIDFVIKEISGLTAYNR